MKISAILPSTCVSAAMSAHDREAAIGQLLSAVGAVRGIDMDLALRDIAARERAGPTLMPAGTYNVAVPHACTNACKQLIMAMGTSLDGIPWGPDVVGLDPSRLRRLGKAHLVVLLMMPPPDLRDSGICRIVGKGSIVPGTDRAAKVG
jgi:hypothetical protein